MDLFTFVKYKFSHRMVKFQPIPSGFFAFSIYRLELQAPPFIKCYLYLQHMRLSEYYLFRMSPQIVPDYWNKWPDYRLQYLFDLKYPTSLRLHVLYEARALSLPQ